MQCSLKTATKQQQHKPKNENIMGRSAASLGIISPQGSGAETSLSALYLHKLFGMGTKPYHIRLKVISAWPNPVIPPEPSNLFFSQNVFVKQGKTKQLL